MAFPLVKLFRWLPALAVLALIAAANATGTGDDPALDITVGGKTRHFTRSQLLASRALRSIAVANDVAYGRAMRYQAVPLSALLPQLPAGSNVQFTARDGFVATIPGKLLTGPGKPWVAVESPEHPWPALKPGGASAGPFYLVWLAPAKAAVSPEQWPYQIAHITEVASLQQRYPQIVPHSGNARILQGMRVYEQNCAACHRLNGGGDAAVGPDLNLPHNPTEYFREPYLRRLIRDPASVRNWPARSMPGFPPQVLDDAALDALLAYLRQMAAQR